MDLVLLLLLLPLLFLAWTSLRVAFARDWGKYRVEMKSVELVVQDNNVALTRLRMEPDGQKGLISGPIQLLRDVGPIGDEYAMYKWDSVVGWKLCYPMVSSKSWCEPEKQKLLKGFLDKFTGKLSPDCRLSRGNYFTRNFSVEDSMKTITQTSFYGKRKLLWYWTEMEKGNRFVGWSFIFNIVDPHYLPDEKPSDSRG